LPTAKGRILGGSNSLAANRAASAQLQAELLQILQNIINIVLILF
jgi:hypothetical protein